MDRGAETVVMAESTIIPSKRECNIAARLSRTAEKMPNAIAVAVPAGRDSDKKRKYRTITFRELDEDSSQLAAALRDYGYASGSRIVLMVRPGIDFISLTYALFKAGVIVVLVDPGMGRKNMIGCLEAVKPDGFIGIPLAQAARALYHRRFPLAKRNVTVGPRLFWGGTTLKRLRNRSVENRQLARTWPEDPAAIIFTTGSTGPPKGVLYRHGNFDTQVDQLRDHYEIQPGEIDMPGFPLFALFNGAMGVTTVIPEMDPTRPADVNPKNILEAIDDWKVTQAFGSPALWNAVGKYCEESNAKMPTLRRVLSAGAPVPPHVIRRIKDAIPADGDIFTPYGCTESLPVASISGAEVLDETASQTNVGRGTCVGRRFSGIDWRIIRIRDDAIDQFGDCEELPVGEIGEVIVRGDVVTTEYVTRTDQNAIAKIQDGDSFWHRIGDVGYLDDQDRFWFCGRKAHRVQTVNGTMFTIPCEAIYNQHEAIYRSALVGVGRPGEQVPVMICEPWSEFRPKTDEARHELLTKLYQVGQASDLTSTIERKHILLHDSLPVDIRHNAKIFREQLAVWASERLHA